MRIFVLPIVFILWLLENAFSDDHCHHHIMTVEKYNLILIVRRVANGRFSGLFLDVLLKVLYFLNSNRQSFGPNV